MYWNTILDIYIYYCMFCLVDKILASRASHVSNVQNCTTDLMASRLALGCGKATLLPGNDLFNLFYVKIYLKVSRYDPIMAVEYSIYVCQWSVCYYWFMHVHITFLMVSNPQLFLFSIRPCYLPQWLGHKGPDSSTWVNTLVAFRSRQDMDVPQKKCPIAAIAIDPSPFRNLGLCAQEKLKYSALD